MPGLHAAVLQRADHLQAGAVADVRQARVGVAAERALQDAAVAGAVEDGAPALELAHALGRLLGVELGHAPVVQHLAADHRVAEVGLPVSACGDVGSAAATPPSAMTVCALPSSDLQTRPTDIPAAAASIAARSPAPPAPMTRTSCSWVS